MPSAAQSYANAIRPLLRPGPAKAQAAPLALRLTAQTLNQPAAQRIGWLRNFISVAEFLAREVRTSAAEAP